MDCLCNHIRFNSKAAEFMLGSIMLSVLPKFHCCSAALLILPLIILLTRNGFDEIQVELSLPLAGPVCYTVAPTQLLSDSEPYQPQWLPSLIRHDKRQ